MATCQCYAEKNNIVFFGLQAQEAQEEIDAEYEAKHSAKEGNQAVKRPAPKKSAVPKAKKTEPMDEDSAEGVPAPKKPAAPRAKKTEPLDEDFAEAIPAPKKPFAPRAKKTEPVDEDFAEATSAPAPVPPVDRKPVVTSKHLLDALLQLISSTPLCMSFFLYYD